MVQLFVLGFSNWISNEQRVGFNKHENTILFTVHIQILKRDDKNFRFLCR